MNLSINIFKSMAIKLVDQALGRGQKGFIVKVGNLIKPSLLPYNLTENKWIMMIPIELFTWIEKYMSPESGV